ncbi:hypothetical protein pdam_00005064 [Pocillopora damicornis]|uniref:Uncharacterized protein n=1 Tax=Pocillopora damicornis TaxID=46731 RepID=A0A3M6T6H4_POCDA|nr:hypothetical protein pdam_00005064 [Pocillopora damicornis]
MLQCALSQEDHTSKVTSYELISYMKRVQIPLNGHVLEKLSTVPVCRRDLSTSGAIPTLQFIMPATPVNRNRFLSCSFLPMLNPQKQMANIGATPTTGAAIPLYKPRIPWKEKSNLTILKSRVPVNSGFCPGSGWGMWMARHYATYSSKSSSKEVLYTRGTSGLLLLRLSNSDLFLCHDDYTGASY